MADASNEKLERAISVGSAKEFRAGADAALIELVRSRPALYDPSNIRFMDNNLKNAIWIQIGKQVKANPSACKRRWYNIRDNYRKALRKRNLGGKLTYKFANNLRFMDNYFKGQLSEDPLATDGRPSTGANRTPKKQNPENSDDFPDQNSTLEEATEGRTPTKTEANEDADQSDDDISNQSESAIDYDMFDKSANVPESSSRANLSSNSPQSNLVDAFLAAIGPTLKGLSPYHLSMAKAEIFATVHKYELKGIMENGCAPDFDTLP